MDILHKVGIKSRSPERVYAALTTLDGLSGWWTSTTSGEASRVGGNIQFRFGEHGLIETKVIELTRDQRVVWEVVGGASEWLGTKIVFDLTKKGDDAVVLFKHAGWREPSDFMHHCSTKWGTFMMSLKAMIETGQGKPHPHDIHIE